jgi:hypothetical protein
MAIADVMPVILKRVPPQLQLSSFATELIPFSRQAMVHKKQQPLRRNPYEFQKLPLLSRCTYVTARN